MGGERSSPTSSIDSSSHPCLSSTSVSRARGDLSTDLKLGLSISTSSLQGDARSQLSNWPPIKPLLRSTLTGRGNPLNPPTLFVKVYMEGIPIGRKLDLYSFNNYDGLMQTLRLMFKTTIILTPELGPVSSTKIHVLTYEDKEGDWMMVGDVPWELFLTAVKRLKITRADRC
ncbi:uncharacterized protein A4U43_C02F22650 [Asparagus officinalis]|uniref:Auxin-responsive protein n=1 Tax=Asparagus officinalis TaxID=4686 RepID=A0A5P1FPB2_ASPOF|nr:auxin-responsive protein IAA4 [Asparagus officinalis]ONK78809.1 uncharacterized protein A4U43_C02F22650 [Asparagus officinalis]